MFRSTLMTAAWALFVQAGLQAQTELIQAQSVQPVTAPVIELQGTLDPRTGRFRRSRTKALGSSGLEPVYDNTRRLAGLPGS